MAQRKKQVADFDAAASQAWLDHAFYIARIADWWLPEGAVAADLQAAAELQGGIPGSLVQSALRESSLGTPFKPFNYYRQQP